jgi:hypothetical protein
MRCTLASAFAIPRAQGSPHSHSQQRRALFHCVVGILPGPVAIEGRPELEAKHVAIFDQLRDVYQYRVAEVFKALGLEERIE